jgi:hypothetical protein
MAGVEGRIFYSTAEILNSVHNWGKIWDLLHIPFRNRNKGSRRRVEFDQLPWRAFFFYSGRKDRKEGK